MEAVNLARTMSCIGNSAGTIWLVIQSLEEAARLSRSHDELHRILDHQLLPQLADTSIYELGGRSF